MKINITYIIIGSICIFLLLIILVVVSKKRKNKYYKSILEKLEINKNLVGSIPISSEIAKVESLNKNNELTDKCNEFQDRLDEIKNTMLPKIDDMLIELDTFYEKKDYENCDLYIAKTELEIYKIREYANVLLFETKEITSSDEKYRGMITKLKTKYRKLNTDYNKHKNLYDEMQDAINMQLENIEKRFLDFEKYMDNNQYNEVVHIVKALTAMIDHMTVVVNETPDLVLMCKQVIPNKLREIEELNKKMDKEGYVLTYLNIEYNLKETRKNVENILDRIRVLNLEDCLFEVKTIVEYLDSLFVDFEKEKLSKKVFEDMNSGFSKKLDKINISVNQISNELEKIKNMYNMNSKDVKVLENESKNLIIINDDYNKMKLKLENKVSAYSELHKEIEDLSSRLNILSENVEMSLKSLGHMYDDEQRAKEQLKEIEMFLNRSRITMNSYKFPVVGNRYYIEMNEASDAVKEVKNELMKKPINIEILNTRVDTARDLTLKLMNTTTEMVKNASFTENLIVFLNRYRIGYSIDNKLDKSEELFMKGYYKEALENSFGILKSLNDDVYEKISDIYNSN